MPNVVNGGCFSDARGTLQFVNEFDFAGVKRFYQIIHPVTEVVRAWQGHRVEHKWFFVGQGRFVIAYVEIDNWDSPSTFLKANHVILSAEKPLVFSLPAGYANGIKALVPGSILTVFSNLTVEESAKDRWSFEPSNWTDWSAF
jgi:dTDP-4-dehydrorhamnose 3,5-epimerase-like enzyme